ncbi:PTS sugar transporter subunit IIC [Alkalibacterium sp. 20]|uniref:PTS sugar transporter subunit IIC n=1 Tax=Alkalibacterium sp. 20 TaxID=1798803 RepID=UPI000B335F59|nr:PTS sugar transporter subunit IIC [Alkalibacterium sp. 20]
MIDNEQYTFKDYSNKVLAGTASGIVIGLIANAILGGIFKALIPYASIFVTLAMVVSTMQFLTPALIGVLVGMQFKLNPMQSVIIGAATFLGSGAYAVTEAGITLVGIGDLVNVMLIAGLAVFVTRFLEGKLGSLTLILLPIIVGAGVGTVGVLTLPYVSLVTTTIGNIINTFTLLQPLLMAILIAVAFSILIISPISTVAIGIAIGISGLGAGAAAIGVTACTAVLVVGSRRVNQKGTTLAILLGAMKMMMPNLVRHPRIVVPIIVNAILSGTGAYLFSIHGLPQTAGFGIVGLVGPIQAINMGSALWMVIMAYFVIPFGGAVLVDLLFNKVLKIYEHEIFEFLPATN